MRTSLCIDVCQVKKTAVLAKPQDYVTRRKLLLQMVHGDERKYGLRSAYRRGVNRLISCTFKPNNLSLGVMENPVEYMSAPWISYRWYSQM